MRSVVCAGLQGDFESRIRYVAVAHSQPLHDILRGLRHFDLHHDIMLRTYAVFCSFETGSTSCIICSFVVPPHTHGTPCRPSFAIHGGLVVVTAILVC